MTILYAILILAVLGLVFGLVLALASKAFYVPQDDRLEPLTAALPGANCGGCGYAGCSAYAKAVLSGEAEVGKCTSGGSECAAKMAEILGVEAVEVAPQVAFVRCVGRDRKLKGDYEGIPDCMAAMRAAGNGPSVCQYGCLGFGNCAKVCQYGALQVVDGHAVVDPEKCTGCLACTHACPRNLIVAIPADSTVTVSCANRDKGPQARKACNYGCIGCTLCQRTCQHDAIHVIDNLAVIDYTKCVGCGDCAAKCPRGLIHFLAPTPAGSPGDEPDDNPCDTEFAPHDPTYVVQVEAPAADPAKDDTAKGEAAADKAPKGE
jgi:Na+-translocating ferredoxin:NAD+ oxidoreductase RNF subunit RnfB